MLTLRRGRVTAVTSRVEGLARIEVDGVPCVAYPRLTGPVALGDDVIVNVQARELALGSGGFDVLYANMTRGLELASDAGAHVIKLPYTPVQTAALHAEEGRELLGASVAVDSCVDADVQCVSVASALLWCAAEEFDAVVCGIGPGVVGTGSSFGHGGVAAAAAANAAAALGGVAVLAVRASQADERERHRGVSHHVRDVLALAPDSATAAWPPGVEAPDWLRPREEVDVSDWRTACEGLPLSHMGRGAEDDELFFTAAFAAGRLARSSIRGL